MYALLSVSYTHLDVYKRQSDKPAETPAACGSACGASDKPAETPAACGSACGASDK